MRMKTIITSFLLLLTLNLSLVADELTDLQKHYNTAIKRVTDRSFKLTKI